MVRALKKIEDPRIEAKLRKILTEPVGAPIELSREEAIAIVEAGIGAWPDLPSGEEYVRQVSRMMWSDLASRD